MTEAFLKLEGVSKGYPLKRFFWQKKSFFPVLKNVSFSLAKGETLGLVGESGCGKSTLARTILRLEEADQGKIIIDQQDVAQLKASELRQFRRKMQMVFQDPYGSLNPYMNIGSIIQEPLDIHKIGDLPSRRAHVAKLCEEVGLRVADLKRSPKELSGGQRQRVGIARAIALAPQLIVADEPVSALDVSIRSQILNLLMDLKEKHGLTYLFISHDLTVVEYISDWVAVMYLGQIMEYGRTQEVMQNPLHPYTQRLLESVPRLDFGQTRRPSRSKVDEISAERLTACPFYARCPKATEICRTEVPPKIKKNTQEVYCHHV